MQQKIDPIVRKETAYIAVWTLIFSLIMQAVFLIIDQWDYTVLLGNLLGGAANVANFFFMALGVARAVEKDEKDAKQALKLSGSLRLLALFVIMLIGGLLEIFNVWAVLIPLLFTRPAIALRSLLDKSSRAKEVEHEDG